MRIKSIRTWIIIILLTIIVITIVSPDNKVEIIQKKDEDQLQTNSTRTTNDSNSLNPNVDFLIDDEIITINTEYIPILYSLLRTSQNIHLTKNQMTLQKMEPVDTYLLSFNCQKSCSHMIISLEKNVKSMLLADSVKLKKHYLSPNYDKILFVFHRFGNDQTMVFDLKEWKKIKYNTLQEAPHQLSIEDVQWLNNNSYEINTITQNENFIQTIVYEEAIE